MHIDKFRIEGFKSFTSVIFQFNRDLNVLTGINNSGKTTVLEAIALWVECFRKRIWMTGKNDSKHGLRSGQYRMDYEGLVDVTSVRCPNFADIFHDLQTNESILLEATLAHESESLVIGFSIRAARGGNYAVKLEDAGKFPFRKFNDFFRRLPDPFNVIYASPVAALQAREEFETFPKVQSRINTRQSMLVLRNRLFQLKKDVVRYQQFVKSVAYILSDDKDPIEFRIDGDETKDVDLQVLVRVGAQDIFKDISLLGSGALQIIEIMLAVHAQQADLNIILLDEPDSHIHRDIQRRLSRKLLEYTEKTQVFLTTHNESLIRSTRPEHIFHLEPRAEKTYSPVLQEKTGGRRKGLQPSRHLKILRTLGSETSIDFLNALEAERLVLVEGEDDARFIHAIVEKATSPVVPFSAMYWSFEGIDGIFAHIGSYREILQQFRNDKNLWEKAVLVIDRDHLTDAQRTAIASGLSMEMNIPVYISTSYTMEATVLSEVDKFKVLLAKLMQAEHGHVVNAAQVSSLVDQSMSSLRNKLSTRLADADFKKGLFNRLKNRRETLKALNVKKAISTYDGALQPDYESFAQNALNQDKLHLLANKDDVADLIQDVHVSLSLPFNADFLFERLIDAATPSTWFDEWKELRDAVK